MSKSAGIFLGVILLSAVLPRALVSADAKQLVVNVQVLDQSLGSANFSKEVVTRPSAVVKFKITITAQGQFVENVVVRDRLAKKLIFVPNSIIVGGVPNAYASNFFGSGINIGTVKLSDTIVITFLAQASFANEFPIGETALTNSAFAIGAGVGEAASAAQVTVNNPEAALSAFSKKSLNAFNAAQNIDAQAVRAKSGDILTYTLFFKNTGERELLSVPMEMDIRDIMDLARVSNLLDAKVVDNGVIKFAPATVGPGAEISRKFQVKIMPADQFPANSDKIMAASFGNEVRVGVESGPASPAGGQVAGGFTAVPPARSPRTGAGEWLVAIFAGLATAGYWVLARR